MFVYSKHSFPKTSKNKKQSNKLPIFTPSGKNTRYVEDDTLSELKLSELERGHPAVTNTQQQAVVDQAFTL